MIYKRLCFGVWSGGGMDSLELGYAPYCLLLVLPVKKYKQGRVYIVYYKTGFTDKLIHAVITPI